MGMVWRILIVVVVAVAGFALWYTQARNAALLADKLGTNRPLGTKTLDELAWNGTYLVIDDEIFDLADSHDKDQAALVVDGSHRLVLTAKGKSIVLGEEHGTLLKSGDPEPQPAFHVAPGDRLTLTRTRGRVIWPNWFETNYMTGNSPRWKRFTTARLRWVKADGSSLELFWRFEQHWYPQDGWVSADMTGPTDCGLVDVRITPGAK